MKEFSFRTRESNIQKLQEQEFDFLIIGGGITGAGVARDAVMRGLSVALVESRDFAFGTSSRSSKLIHGGIRYLENYEFALVYEALNERTRLFEMAPHLVHPLRFILPVYKGDRVGMGMLGLGMWAYDALALFDVPKLHERLSPAMTAKKVPSLLTEGLQGAYEYSDAYMDDDRLTIETLRSAHAHGTMLMNYVKAGEASFEDGKVVALHCEDQKSGKKFLVRAKHFVSTVGPWTDQLGHEVLKKWKPILRPSKGIHITLDRKRLPLRDAVVMSTRADKRIIFGIPRHEMIIIGTTDTDFRGDPADVKATAEDVRYLLGIVDQYFPHAKIRKEDILATYAGVRPLVADDSETESATSREHVIFTDPRNVTFVAGGKYTTYRHMSAQTVDVALKALPESRRDLCRKVNTALPLNPLVSSENYWRSQNYIDNWVEASGLNRQEVKFLVARHGMETQNILADVKKGSEFSDLWSMEAIHAIQNTMCMSLLDFYVRRSPLMLARKDHGLGMADWLGQVFAAYLGWSDSQTRSEVTAVHNFIKSEYAWRAEL